MCVALGILPDVTLGTLGKSLGSAGGFAGTSSLVREYLINVARGFIFSTGLAPASAGAALEAVRIVSAQPEMGRKLLERATYFRECLRAEGIDVPMDDSPIVPVILGENELTMRAAEELRRQGIVVHGIRPPTVPEGTSRLRLSVTLAHSREDLKRVAHAVADVVGARAAR